MTYSHSPRYWEGWDQLETKLIALHARLETMSDRWRWAVRMEIKRVNAMLGERSLDQHYLLERRDYWLPGEKRCVCGLQYFDAPENPPFPKVEGHIDWPTRSASAERH